ncbi:MAG: Bug family tripartite tricarboxylate transporter substrate binding protein [Burkholderiales bacterium]
MNVARLILALIFSLAGASVPAQEPFPSRPVTFVVPITQGTAADIMARLIGAKLAERWKQPVVIENKPGASGTIGASLVARAAPNGYTLLLPGAIFTMAPAVIKNLNYDPANDFVFISLTGSTNWALAVNNATMPAMNLEEFVALVRAHPGRFHYATPGSGSPHHFGFEMFKHRLGLDVVHVPYKGAAGAMTDLLSGQVQVMLVPAGTAIANMRAARFRILAVSGPDRLGPLPDVPTFREQGIDFLEALDGWSAVFAPAKTPRAIVERINTDFRAVTESEEIRKQFDRQGLMPRSTTIEQTTEIVRADLARWAKVAIDAKIAAE